MKKFIVYFAMLWCVIGVGVPVQAQQQLQPIGDTLQTLATTGNGSQLNVYGYNIVTLTIIGSEAGTDRVATFEKSQDGTNFIAVMCNNTNTNVQSTSVTTSGTTVFQFRCSVAGDARFRVVISGGATGAVTATATAIATNSGNVSIGTLVSKYNGAETAGYGFPVIRAVGHFAGQTAAKTIATYTPSVDTSIGISGQVLVTTTSAENFTMTVAYTDTGNTARTVTIPFRIMTGANVLIVNFVNGAIPYAGVLTDIRVKGGTAVTLATTGTFTGCTYSVGGSIREGFAS